MWKILLLDFHYLRPSCCRIPTHATARQVGRCAAKVPAHRPVLPGQPARGLIPGIYRHLCVVSAVRGRRAAARGHARQSVHWRAQLGDRDADARVVSQAGRGCAAAAAAADQTRSSIIAISHGAIFCFHHSNKTNARVEYQRMIHCSSEENLLETIFSAPSLTYASALESLLKSLGPLSRRARRPNHRRAAPAERDRGVQSRRGRAGHARAQGFCQGGVRPVRAAGRRVAAQPPVQDHVHQAAAPGACFLSSVGSGIFFLP